MLSMSIFADSRDCLGAPRPNLKIPIQFKHQSRRMCAAERRAALCAHAGIGKPDRQGGLMMALNLGRVGLAIAAGVAAATATAQSPPQAEERGPLPLAADPKPVGAGAQSGQVAVVSLERRSEKAVAAPALRPGSSTNSREAILVPLRKPNPD